MLLHIPGNISQHHSVTTFSFWQLAATRASSFSTSLPHSLPPSQVDIGLPMNKKDPIENKRLTFGVTLGDSPYERDLILVIKVRAIIRYVLIVHTFIWEQLHTSAATPLSLMFSVASTIISSDMC